MTDRNEYATEKDLDAALVAEFKEGSETAFARLVERYSGKTFQLAYGVLGNREDAEEVAQDAFIKVHKHIQRFRGDASFSTWLYRITINLAKNRYHWNKRRGSAVNISAHQEDVSGDGAKWKDIDLPDQRPNPEQNLRDSEFRRDIMAGMEKLPDKSREILALRHLKEFRYEKIAEILGCRVGTVKSRLARARETLKQMVDL